MILANPNHAQYLHSPSSQAMGSSSSYDHRQNATLLDLFNVFYRTGSLVYGGGQVRCTYVQRKNTEAVYTSVKFRGFLMTAGAPQLAGCKQILGYLRIARTGFQNVRRFLRKILLASEPNLLNNCGLNSRYITSNDCGLSFTGSTQAPLTRSSARPS